MIENTDGLMSFILGLFIGLVVAAISTINARQTAIHDTVILTCGTCQEKGKICGEFVCTRDGWE
jgi:hypothetical protein